MNTEIPETPETPETPNTVTPETPETLESLSDALLDSFTDLLSDGNHFSAITANKILSKLSTYTDNAEFPATRDIARGVEHSAKLRKNADILIKKLLTSNLFTTDQTPAATLTALKKFTFNPATENEPVTAAKTAIKTAKTVIKTAKQTLTKNAAENPPAKKTAAEKTGYVSLTNGGARPAIFGTKIPVEIQTRHSYLFTFLEKSGLINAREIAFFIGIRPDLKKSARVSDYFAFTGKNVIDKFPADKFKSEKISIAAALKKYADLKPIGKLTDVIIYLTAHYGTKKLTLNFSFKYSS